MQSPAKQFSAIELELFTNRFRAIAEEMGEMLRRTAVSTNVKERLDFSCAVLDAEGDLVVNAPHIPVHLGALGLCVRSVREAVAMREGDVVVTNHPGFGGSHLPDISVITPVYFAGELLGFVANRAHHAEIGGTRPGSMPPNATSLAEEGAVITPMYLIEKGKSRWQEIEQVFTSGQFPTRSLLENIADLNAAVAANHRGVFALQKMTRMHSPDEVRFYMDALKNHAKQQVEKVFEQFDGRRFFAEEFLDDGARLQVNINIKAGRAVFDFTGTSPVHSGNLNATPAIVRSAVMYVLRLLVKEPLPLNEGVMQAVELKLPICLLNPDFPDDPAKAPAVVGGNVETSQRLVDTLLKAFGVMACGQGTMNNTLFGNDAFGYYETICGGSGAGPGFHGASAVHTHMTNTRITDPEIIERRYPVRLERFEIRKNSGGGGQFRGGDGAVREITFLEPVALSMVTQHRVQQPFGLNGGEPGKSGRQRVVRRSGEIIELSSVDACDVKAGDKLIIETPGGGGFCKIATDRKLRLI